MTCKRILANTIFTSLEFCFLGKHCPMGFYSYNNTFGEVQQVSGFYASYRENHNRRIPWLDIASNVIWSINASVSP